MNIDYDELADKIAARMMANNQCNIRTMSITSEEHEDDHKFTGALKEWVRPIMSDMQTVGRRVILFGIFFMAAMGLAIMFLMAWLMKAGIAPIAFKLGMTVDPSMLMAWVKGGNNKS